MRECRNCRQGVDLVFDDVEKELLRERELIYGIKDQLVGLLDKVVLQIRRLRAFVYNLTVDLQYKQKTLKIEEHNGKLDKNHIDTSVLSGDKNVFKPAWVNIYLLLYSERSDEYFSFTTMFFFQWPPFV